MRLILASGCRPWRSLARTENAPVGSAKGRQHDSPGTRPGTRAGLLAWISGVSDCNPRASRPICKIGGFSECWGVFPATFQGTIAARPARLGKNCRMPSETRPTRRNSTGWPHCARAFASYSNVMLNSLDVEGRPQDTRVVVAMSGGVDSSVTAALLRDEGYDVVGVTLQLYDHGAATHRKGACCAGQDIHDARGVAARLGIPHYVLDYESRFKEAVIDRFAASYLS